MDTGADISVYPRNKLRGPANRDTCELFAANGSRIATYGIILVSFDLSLQRTLKWRFTVAEVNTPIIGVDFLSYYGLLVDSRNKQLIHTTTNLSIKGYTDTIDRIKTIIGESTYYDVIC